MRLPKFPLKASIRVIIFVDWSSHTRYRFRFWLAVQDLKRQPLQDVPARAQEIWQEFLAEGAPSSINLDSHSFERTSQNLKDPGRYSFEDAQVMVVPCFSHTVWSTRLQNSYTVWRQTVSSISLFRGQFLFTVRSSVNAFQHTLHLSSPSISGAHIHTHEKWQLCTLFAIRHLPRPPVCQKEGEPSFPADLHVFDFPWTIGFDCFFSSYRLHNRSHQRGQRWHAPKWRLTHPSNLNRHQILSPETNRHAIGWKRLRRWKLQLYFIFKQQKLLCKIKKKKYQEIMMIWPCQK